MIEGLGIVLTRFTAPPAAPPMIDMQGMPGAPQAAQLLAHGRAGGTAPACTHACVHPAGDRELHRQSAGSASGRGMLWALLRWRPAASQHELTGPASNLWGAAADVVPAGPGLPAGNAALQPSSSLPPLPGPGDAQGAEQGSSGVGGWFSGLFGGGGGGGPPQVQTAVHSWPGRSTEPFCRCIELGRRLHNFGEHRCTGQQAP